MAVKRKLSKKLFAQIEQEITNTDTPNGVIISKAKAKAMAMIVADLTADLDSEARELIDPYIAQIKTI